MELPNGQVIRHTSVRGTPPALHPRIQNILNQVPRSQRGSGHGRCGLPVCLSNALAYGMDPTGSNAAALIIRSNIKHPKHGYPIGPCDSCKTMVKEFDLDFLTGK